MCQLDSNIEKMFAATIGEFIEQGRAFTGYDLTLRTREREKVKLRHADCRQGVHEMQVLIDLVEFDTWNKDLHDLGNGLQAILYYPNGFDKSQYQPVSMVQFQPSIPVTPIVSTTPLVAVGSPLGSDDDDDDADDSGGELPDGTFKTDYRGRLLIPTRFLKSIGVVPKDEVVVDTYLDRVVLRAADNNSDSSNTQIVERNGEVRLSKRTLHLSGLIGNYTIENDNNCVVIKGV